MQVIMAKANEEDCLWAMDDKAMKLVNKLDPGDQIVVDIKPNRNVEFLRKGFVLLTAMYENQERFTNEEDFRTEISILCGWYRQYVRHNGEIVYTPKSWSFADMDEEEFAELYSKMLDIALKRFGYEFANRFM